MYCLEVTALIFFFFFIGSKSFLYFKIISCKLRPRYLKFDNRAGDGHYCKSL